MRENNRTAILLLVLAMLLTTCVAAAEPLRLKDLYAQGNETIPVSYEVDIDALPYYDAYLTELVDKGITDVQNVSVVLPAAQSMSDEGTLVLTTGEADREAIICQTNRDYTFAVTAPQSGFYQVRAIYRNEGGHGNSIVRALYVDGQLPFREAMNIQFFRFYAEADQKLFDVNGDDIRPLVSEQVQWCSLPLNDTTGLYNSPLKIYLEAGMHELTLSYISEEFVLDALVLESPEEYVSYSAPEEYLTVNTSEVLVRIEAEDFTCSSDPTLKSECNQDPKVFPVSNGDFRLNIFGGSKWKQGNQWADWSFSVPADGWYQLTFKVLQSYNDGRSSYRQIAIDGQVPYDTLLAYEFPYDTNWQYVTLKNTDGSPMYFYLAEGTHTLRMTCKIGPMATLVNQLTGLSLDVSAALRDITKVTGSSIDPNFQYELHKKIPGLMESLQDMILQCEAQAAFIEEMYDSKPTVYYNILSMQELFEDLLNDPDSITIRYDELENAQINLSQWAQDLQMNALAVDFIAVHGHDATLPSIRASILESFSSFATGFTKSFTKDYTSVGSSSENVVEVVDTINVWVSLGREWAEVLRDMADNSFYPATGIKVNISTFPSGQMNTGSSGAVNTLLLAINSGTAPDVAIGVDTTSPVEFAIRGATAKLNELEGFDDVASWFSQGAFEPYTYKDDVYALPCTQDFTVIFYRKDILSELGIGIPITWDGLYQILPVLQSNGMEFYYPSTLFDPFLYQNGGDYYSEDYTRTGLDTPAALRAFEQWTGLYTNYRLPTTASFFNRFRTGQMPIGIGGYNEYIQLSIGAPELEGRWGIAAFPGTRQADGSIDNTVGASVNSTNIILESSSKKEAAWTFLQWWMSEETQVEYGKLVESAVGIGARWNTANVDAFQKLPWTDDEISVIAKQWENLRMQPVVPGSYSTGRHVSFAWNKTVISGFTPRDALEEAVEKINTELKTKQEEYNETVR